MTSTANTSVLGKICAKQLCYLAQDHADFHQDDEVPVWNDSEVDSDDRPLIGW